MDTIRKIDKILDESIKFIMAVTMFALVAGGFWQIFTRWVLNDPSTVTEEFMKYTLIWASMIGSAYAFYTNQHLSLDLIKTKVTGKKLVVLNIFIEICILFFISYVLVYGGYNLSANSTNSSPVMQIPFKYIYSIMPISGIFIVVTRFLSYLKIYLEAKEKKERGDL